MNNGTVLNMPCCNFPTQRGTLCRKLVCKEGGRCYLHRNIPSSPVHINIPEDISFRDVSTPRPSRVMFPFIRNNVLHCTKRNRDVVLTCSLEEFDKLMTVLEQSNKKEEFTDLLAFWSRYR
ncbi:Hypothetical protein ZAZAV_123 [Cedratvirus Zaza IHUMI]|uniref:Uncharacterized protein n=1 Tax=Cedratvirus Zaza IHUMI TaxID=2126979 RepID=A0A2R8FDM8_9VIRU|nr:Hypothetical protein ZAZAV_123 [Cedratvirus Zaza IHUMI]